MTALCLICLLLGYLQLSSADHTFLHQDPITGETLKCNKCPPGTFMAARCTSEAQTKCNPCRSGHYTELWNYLSRCLYCSNICTLNEEVETECSAVKNRVCRCKEGFYRMDDFCLRHSQCPPGQGVKTNGTREKNTKCEKCPKGHFSSSSSALDPCLKHQECTDGQVVLLPGSAKENTVCGTCDSLVNGSDEFRTLLKAVFSSHEMRKRDLKSFIHKVIHGTEEDDCPGDSALPKQRVALLNQIRTWLTNASSEQLKKLPEILMDSQCGSVSKKVHKVLRDIKKQNLSCSL